MNSHNSIMENCLSIGIKACSEHGRSKRRRLVEGKENSESSAASRFMSNKATKDIVHEILLRVSDSKSAIQCSSVCKTWLSVVANQNFINAFNRRHCSDPTQYTFLFRGINFATVQYNLSFTNRNCPTETARCLDFLPWRRRAKVRASCDSFLLLSLSLIDFCICSPLTKQWRFLPEAPIHKGNMEVCGLSLLPNDDYNDNILRFKVVVVYAENDLLQANVFCSESRVWTKCVTRFPQNIWCSYPSVACNGVLYWIGTSKSFHGLFAYDPFQTDEAKRHRYVNKPSINNGRQRGKRGHTRIGAVQGRLRYLVMFQVKKEPLNYRLIIWEQQQQQHDDSEWRVVHDVRPSLPQESMVIGFHPEDGDVMFVSCERDVCRYEIEDDKLEKVGRLPMSDAAYLDACGSVFWLESFTVAQPSSWPKLIPRLRDKKKKKKKR